MKIALKECWGGEGGTLWKKARGRAEASKAQTHRAERLSIRRALRACFLFRIRNGNEAFMRTNEGGVKCRKLLHWLRAQRSS